MTKEIQLTQGQVTTIDDKDYPSVSKHKWYAKKSKYGYNAYTSINGKDTKLSRFIMKPKKNMVVDHINHNTLDNTRNNLRICTSHQNNMNQNLNSKNKSGYKGVHYDKASKKWRAKLQIDGKKKHLGYYDSPEMAARAYNGAALFYFGEFAQFNILPPEYSIPNFDIRYRKPCR